MTDRHARPEHSDDPAVLAAETPAEHRAASESLGDLVGQMSEHVSTLMRQEVELAKAEAKEQAKRAGVGAGMFGGAGIGGVMTLLFLSLALMFALGDWLDHLGWGALIVGVIWAIVALVLYLMGRSKMQEIEPMPETVDSVKRIPEVMTTNEENR